MAVSRNVLVPLDGSELAERALDAARDVAEAITLLVVTYATTAEPLREFAASEDVSTADAAAIYLDQVAARLSGIEVRKVTVAGTNVAEEIVGYAEANDVSMIAMSTHGRSGVGRWLLGNITDKVVRSAPVPVLVVPARA